MVNEYLRQNCEYRLGSLKPQIFLLPKEGTAINYSIDNNTCEVKGINAETIYEMIGVSTRFEETSNEAGRFNYTSTVTFTMREQWGEPWIALAEQLTGGNYYVVFEDTMGVQYIQTPEFTSDISYQYTFDNSTNNGNTLELYFRCDSNVPACILYSKVIANSKISDNDCAYLGGHLENLRMCPKQFCYIESSENRTFTNIYTTGGETFRRVEPCDRNFQFRHQYSNGEYRDTITFTIPMSDYKYYFHYSLEEFVNNRYAVLFDTTDGDNTIATGFEFGYFPEYTIQTSEEQMELNTITITLRHAGSYSFLYASERDTHIIEDDVPSYAKAKDVIDPVTGHLMSDYVCADNTMAIVTLLKILTSDGQFTGNYAVLEGYEQMYQNLPVTMTYKLTDNMGINLRYYSYECASGQGCKFLQYPSNLSFSEDVRTRTATVEATCDWTIATLPSWITVNVSSGSANVPVSVTFTSSKTGEGSDSGVITYVTDDRTAITNVKYEQSGTGTIEKQVLGDDWSCNGCNSYYYYHTYESYDNGQTWHIKEPDEKTLSDIPRYEPDPDCGCWTPGEPIYKYVDVDGYICE